MTHDQLLLAIKGLQSHVESMASYAQSEQAAKQSLVLPVLSALGYNALDLTEVVPEFRADVFQTKGARVDYAILKDNVPIILIECKPVETELSDQIAKQLYKYFISTEARVGVLTNGLHYRFYTDLDKPNKMDSTPFLKIDIVNDSPEKITDWLQLLTKPNFEIRSIQNFAKRNGSSTFSVGLPILIAYWI